MARINVTTKTAQGLILFNKPDFLNTAIVMKAWVSQRKNMIKFVPVQEGPSRQTDS
jgi:hypothetical protein